ncbi:MAG: hypothetical protein CMB80_04800 [Flammeovirgaceae bacterium]|nr:hypothetical protein [Flammeovirgaceae bacterium]
MIKLNKKYVIGTHVMFFEIEMYRGFIDGLVNLLENIDNKENVIIDLCFNISEHIEKIDRSKISEDQLTEKFNSGVNVIRDLGFKVNTRIIKDEFYFHTDYRRDLNYHYCKKVDYIMWGETDSFFPKEAFQAIETLAQYTDEQNIHRYLLSFADRKMWDSSWDDLVHPDYIDHIFVDDDQQHLNQMQAKSPLPIEKMNEINAEAEGFDFTYIKYPKISGACLVLSADLIKFGVNVPSCMVYNDDHGLSIMAQKLLGENYLQFVCKNLLHVHARRHPEKRLYVLDEENPNSFEDKKTNKFSIFKRMSEANLHNLTSGNNKFYEYDNLKKELNK